MEKLSSKYISTFKPGLTLILIIAFLYGTAFIFLTPAWWHHDEPGHFQVAWFFANHNRFQQVEEYDPDMRLDLALSLEEHGFYAYRNYKLDLTSPAEPWVMSPQANDPKLAYLLYSLPLRFSSHLDLADQLILLRFISLSYYLAAIAAIYYLAVEIFPKDSPIPSLAGLFFGLLPGAANQMTAVSNEPLGALLFTLFLFFAFRALKGVPIARGWAPMLVTAILVAFTINAVWISLAIVVALVAAFSLFHGRLRFIPYLLPLLLIGGLPFLFIEKGEARYWYNSRSEPIVARSSSPISPLDGYVLHLSERNAITQRVPADLIDSLAGTPATLGFYAWSSSPRTYELGKFVEVRYASLPDDQITLNQQPTWYSIPLMLDEELGNVKLRLMVPKGKGTDSPISVTFQAITLASGNRQGVPEFADPSLTAGNWDGAGFTNLLRNSDLTETWFNFNNRFLNSLSVRLPVNFDQSILASLQDPATSGWYFSRVTTSLSQTYWGKIGASNFELLGAPYLYWLLDGLLAVNVIFGFGALYQFRRHTYNPQVYVGIWVILIIWGQTYLRGASSLDLERIVIPWARYASTTFPLLSAIFAANTVYAFSLIRLLSFNMEYIAKAVLAAILVGLPLISILSLFSKFQLNDAYAVQLTIGAYGVVLLLFLALYFGLARFNSKKVGF